MESSNGPVMGHNDDPGLLQSDHPNLWFIDKSQTLLGMGC